MRDEDWYAERAIDLRVGCPARALDIERRIVYDAQGGEHRYDQLVLATGSRPALPPISGMQQRHVFLFRTQRDVERIAGAARKARHAIVVGGGLLGLEAAAGLLARGVAVTVVERDDRLMPQQLDAGAAILRRTLAGLGIETVTGCGVATIWLNKVRLQNREVLPADIVVIAAGVRPEARLAQNAGIELGRGILVDDEMRTSAPSVFAVGECAEHRRTVYGLWAPIVEQAAAAAAAIGGSPGAFLGSVTSTTLKIAQVGVFAGGRQSAAAGEDELVWSDGRQGVYRKLVLDGGRLTGALLVGDTSLAGTLSTLLRTGAECPPSLLDPAGPTEVAAPAEADVICSCNAVTRGTIMQAIRDRELQTLAQVTGATRASSGCGSCARDIEALLSVA